MTHSLEYHILVRPLIPASLALFGMLLLISTSPAQNSTAASSGHSVSAASASTAHVSTNSGVTSSAKTPHSTTSSHNNNGRPQHTTPNPLPYYYYPYVYAVPVPYSADVLDNGASDDNDPNYQGGPTVFDRRGAGPYSYIPPGYESPDEPTAAQTQIEDTPPAGFNPSPEPPPGSHRLGLQRRSSTRDRKLRHSQSNPLRPHAGPPAQNCASRPRSPGHPKAKRRPRRTLRPAVVPGKLKCAYRKSRRQHNSCGAETPVRQLPPAK